jgi:TonB family protein
MRFKRLFLLLNNTSNYSFFKNHIIMKQTIVRGSFLVLAATALLFAGSCRNGKLSPDTESSTTGEVPPPPAAPRAVPGTGATDTSKVYTSVERMPSFPGGEPALMKYLHDHIHYPRVARENGIQGTVVVQFIVGRDGELHSITTLGTKKGGGLEQEAERVVKSMPRWEPGSEKGIIVNVQYSLPVRFVLQ